MNKNKITPIDFIQKKEQGQKIVILTAYDYPFARLLDQAGLDAILVGDSLGNVVLGHSNTLEVTVEDMIYHTKAVQRAVQHALVIADMPFMSYQISKEKAVENAGRLVKEGRADVVKLEGGKRVVQQVRAIVDAGIDVMGHIGLTPFL